jgi:hypothetical protein
MWTWPPRHICPALANTGPSTLGDATSEAATDTVNRTLAQTTSAERRLKRFTKRISQQPLLELPIEDTSYGRYALPSFSTRSKRIAAHSISHILASKRAGYLVMKVYDEMFSGDSNM